MKRKKVFTLRSFLGLGSSFGSVNGFTLIELLVVIGILAVISAGVMAALNPIEQIQKTNDAKRKSDLAQVQRALEAFYQDNGRYPFSTDPSEPSLCGNSNPCPNYRIVSLDADNPVKDWGQSWQPYMVILPKDSNPNNSYVYYSPPDTDGQTYYLYASLDREGQDPQVCYPGGGNLKCSNAPNGACGGVCNYGVSSQNTSP